MLSWNIALLQYQQHPPKAQNILSVSLLQIGGIDARSVQKTPAGVLPVRRGLFAVAAWTPLVLTSSEFRLYAKLTVKTIQGCIVLAMRQRRYTEYLQKTLDTHVTGYTILTAHSSQLTA